MKQIGNLKELRYLNLYGTQVSDAGLKHLHSLKNLKAIYLWQSEASAKGAKALEQALPDAKVNLK
jgi:Leucine-rich repeat (LRR) protein